MFPIRERLKAVNNKIVIVYLHSERVCMSTSNFQKNNEKRRKNAFLCFHFDLKKRNKYTPLIRVHGFKVKLNKMYPLITIQNTSNNKRKSKNCVWF